MTAELQTVLFLLTLLQFKHLFADFFLQTPKMLAARHVYLHSGRVQHAGLHGLFSFGVFLIIGAPVVFALILCAVEAVVHYHIDWLKGVHGDKAQDGPDTAAYWRAFGVDQLMHQLTYVAMIWVSIHYIF